MFYQSIYYLLYELISEKLNIVSQKITVKFLNNEALSSTVLYIAFNGFKFYPWLRNPVVIGLHLSKDLGSGSNTFQVISCHGGQQFSEQYRLLKKLANFFALRTKKSSHTLILLCTVGITQPPLLFTLA